MAKTLKDLRDNLVAMLKDLEEHMNEEVIDISNDALALVKSRLINDKVLADGQPLGDYSQAVVPFWFYKSKETNRDSKKAVQELYDKHGYFASYKDWREINNLPTDSINLSFTNQMWTKMISKVVESKAFKVSISFTCTTKKETEKLGYHVERWPLLLQLNEQELEFVRKANLNRRWIDRFRKFKIIE